MVHHQVTISDSLVVTDYATSAVHYRRSVSDSARLTDEVARVVQYVRPGGARAGGNPPSVRVAMGGDVALRVQPATPGGIEPGLEDDTAAQVIVQVRASTKLSPRPLTGEEQAIAVLVAQSVSMFVSLDLGASGLEAAWTAVVTYLLLRSLVRRLPPTG